MMRFAVASAPLDLAALRNELANPRHGGFCAFEGWVRDTNDGRGVDALEYEVYAELARAEGDRILAEARERFGAIDAVAIHRDGLLHIGELAVWVGVSSPHRDAAFRACRFIIDQIKHRLPVWKKEHYRAGDTAWVACAHAHASHEHAPHQYDTHGQTLQVPAFMPDYARQERLPGVGAEGQARLAAAKVLVIGAGGLGCPALGFLAGAGIGTLGIVDHDRVEASNLHRQLLFGVADLGRLKVEAASDRIRAINPSVRVEAFARRLRADEAAQLFARFDLVLDCSDDMRGRFLCSDAAVLSGTPLILASVHQHEGQLQIVRPRANGPCLRCLWPEEPGAGESCAQSGVLGPVPGVLGAMQANEALKLLLELKQPADHALLLVDLLENTTRRLRIDRAQGCDARGGCRTVAEQAMRDAAAEPELRFATLEDALSAGLHLVDLRTEQERTATPIAAPAQWLPSPLVLERRGELPDRTPILLVCAGGVRSLAAARRLRAAGMDQVFSLRGGLAGLEHHPTERMKMFT